MTLATLASQGQKVDVPMMLKFGEKEHLLEFQRRGALFMRKLSLFAGMSEGELARADPWEGCDLILQPHRGRLKFTLKDGQVIEPEVSGAIRINQGRKPMPHVYCMTCLISENAELQTEAGQPLLDSRLERFGSHVAAVINVPEFLRRLERGLQDLGKIDYGPVVYAPEEHHGEITYLTKSVAYQWQSEFRVALYGGGDSETIIPELGSLEDIVVVGEAAEVIHSVSFERRDTAEG